MVYFKENYIIFKVPEGSNILQRRGFKIFRGGGGGGGGWGGGGGGQTLI